MNGDMEDFGHFFVAHAVFFYHLEDEAAAGRQLADGLPDLVYYVGGDAEFFGVANVYHGLDVYIVEQYNGVLVLAGDVVEAEVLCYGVEIDPEVVYFGQFVFYLPELYKNVGNDFVGHFTRFYE